MEKIGFIGLGTMGSAMAANIAKAGYPLSLWNRTQAKAEALEKPGIAICSTPAQLAAASDIVIVMVFGPEALADVLLGDTGACAGLKPGAVLINMSTVSRDATLAAAEAVEACGACFIDAPVAGSKKPAQDGALTILAGGDKQSVDRATPLLKTMGRIIFHCGPVGQGTAMKLFINLFLGTLMQTLAEGLCVGKHMGLDLPGMLETIDNSAASCPLFRVKGAAIGQGDFSKNFPVDLLFKDLNLVLAEAGKLGVPLPMTAAAREAFSSARAMGLGDEDMAAVVKVLEALTGSEMRAAR